MNILVIIFIVVVTILILSKGAKRSQGQNPAQAQSSLPRMQIGLYAASQTAIMFLLFVFRGLGKSLSNAAFHIVIVLALIIVGSVICLALHHRKAKAIPWIILFSTASVLNVLIWEITKAMPE
ncbi:MAG: hypothetical protein M0042_09690 [Nitrospiraceae bacterium]|nr:hypothetical protein [Nitrospiraceae bacterium]